MIVKMASAIVSFLEKHNATNPNFRDVYIYGCDIALYTVLSTFGLLCIGTLLGRPWESAILIAIFYINQSMGGGYHASTHTRCFMTMSVGLMIFCIFCTLTIDTKVVGCIGLAASVILYSFPLVLHKNKQHLANKSNSLIHHSRMAILVQVTLFLGTLFLYAEYAQAIAFSLLISAFSRCVAVALQNRAAHK